MMGVIMKLNYTNQLNTEMHFYNLYMLIVPKFSHFMLFIYIASALNNDLVKTSLQVI